MQYLLKNISNIVVTVAASFMSYKLTLLQKYTKISEYVSNSSASK